VPPFLNLYTWKSISGVVRLHITKPIEKLRAIKMMLENVYISMTESPVEY